MIAYKRVLLKVSGEALSDGAGGINGESVKKLAQQLKEVADCGVPARIWTEQPQIISACWRQ